MLTSWRSLLLLVALAAARAIAQDEGVVLYPLPPSENNQRLIDRLRETPVKQIEPRLPDESFDTWLYRLVKPKRVEYEVRETRERTGSVYMTTLWVVAYTQPPQPDGRPWISQADGRPWIQVRFMVVDVKPSKTASNQGQPNPFALKFVDALLLQTAAWPTDQGPGGYPVPIPTGPQRKQSYDRFPKLSRLEDRVKREQGKETPRRIPL